MPAVVFIHGGGWRNGDKYPSQVRSLAERGFFGVSINYRLSGNATFPAAVEDCKCAVRWLMNPMFTWGISFFAPFLSKQIARYKSKFYLRL
jgi:acetyl esterase/lipase